MKDPIIEAAQRMDWMQPVLNGSPPCFHIQEDGRFCGRADRWAGHVGNHSFHEFVSFEEFIEKIRVEAWNDAIDAAKKSIPIEHTRLSIIRALNSLKKPIPEK